MKNKSIANGKKYLLNLCERIIEAIELAHSVEITSSEVAKNAELVTQKMIVVIEGCYPVETEE